MIRFELQPEPANWDARCRQMGRKWLRVHRDYSRPHDYWIEFSNDLSRAFRGMCAYCAMVVMKADMDHFVPVAYLKKNGNEELAYEWSNFRSAEGVLNRRKSDHLILDPFEVRDDWFEIILPSLQLRLTDKIPEDRRQMAEFTVQKLGLEHDEVVIRYRQMWFEMYRKRDLTLRGLIDKAPLIARAVEQALQNGRDWRYPLPDNGHVFEGS